MLLGIIDNTVLQWEIDDGSIIITPLFKLGKFLSEKREKVGMTQSEANQLVDNLTPEAIQCLHSAVQNKLN